MFVRKILNAVCKYICMGSITLQKVPLKICTRLFSLTQLKRTTFPTEEPEIGTENRSLRHDLELRASNYFRQRGRYWSVLTIYALPNRQSKRTNKKLEMGIDSEETRDGERTERDSAKDRAAAEAGYCYEDCRDDATLNTADIIADHCVGP